MSKICEKDWKIVRTMKNDALDLACQRIIEKLSKIIASKKKGSHVRYLELWNLLKAEDKNIALMFDDMKRSNAFLKLARWRFNNLITDSDLESFSPETFKIVEALLETWR
jgi:hypothetical protein